MNEQRHNWLEDKKRHDVFAQNFSLAVTKVDDDINEELEDLRTSTAANSLPAVVNGGMNIQAATQSTCEDFRKSTEEELTRISLHIESVENEISILRKEIGVLSSNMNKTGLTGDALLARITTQSLEKAFENWLESKRVSLDEKIELMAIRHLAACFTPMKEISLAQVAEKLWTLVRHLENKHNILMPPFDKEMDLTARTEQPTAKLATKGPFAREEPHPLTKTSTLCARKSPEARFEDFKRRSVVSTQEKHGPSSTTRFSKPILRRLDTLLKQTQGLEPSFRYISIMGSLSLEKEIQTPRMLDTLGTLVQKKISSAF